ncbi:FAD-dependent monooxygenase [bacterium]|nr:FAD-dependent monooxygenase [bacterium]
MILIVGAGPTGLTLAIELARRQVPVRIIEKSNQVAQRGRAVGVQSRTQEIFEAMSVLQLPIRLGLPVVGESHFVDGKMVRSTQPVVSNTAPYPNMLALEQNVIEKTLVQQLLNLRVSVEWNRRFLGLEQNENSVVAQLDGETVEVDYLVACDGANSAVRRAAGIAFPGKAYPYLFSLADVAVEWDLPLDRSYIFRRQQKTLGMLPVARPNQFRMWTKDLRSGPHSGPSDDEVRHGFVDEQPPDLGEFQEFAGQMVGRNITLTSPRLICNYQIECRLAESYRKGRVLLAGDAAHVHAPTGFQGMNMGIQDAYNLGWKLARVVRQQVPAELLETYQKERRPIAQEVLLQTDEAVENFETPRSVGQQLMEQYNVPWWQLEFHYRSADQDGAGGKGLQSGDRAPDGEVLSPQGLVRVFQLLRGQEYNALAFPGSDTSLRQLHALARHRGVKLHVIGPGNYQDPNDTLRSTYGVGEDGLILIRPDGYVAARGRLDEAARVLAAVGGN